MSTARIAIVGTSLAGLTAARTLRQQGFAGALVLIGNEPHQPYDRPPLSKEILRGEWDLPRIQLAQGDLGDVEWRLGHAASGFDVSTRSVRVGQDWESFDGVVIATGATPRRLPGSELAGVHALRTLDEALALRADLTPGAHIVIVGAGFVGQEVAASCRRLGHAVTMVEAATPAQHVLGVEVGGLLADLHRREGVDVRLGDAVKALHGEDLLRAVELRNGDIIEADVAVVGIGVMPNTDWLVGSGLTLDNGVVCDATCLAAPGIVAAGDVARWPNLRYADCRRFEHWDNAVRQADHAARRLLYELGGAPVGPYSPVPWFWSDQYGVKFQLVGSTAGHDEVRVIRSVAEPGRFVALYRKADRLVAAATLGNTRVLLRYRRALEDNPAWDIMLAEAM